jgi:hypothetical protein
MNAEDKREIAELLEHQTGIMVKFFQHHVGIIDRSFQHQTGIMVESFQHHVDFLLSGMKSLDDKLSLIAADVAAFRSNNSTQRDSRL